MSPPTWRGSEAPRTSADVEEEARAAFEAQLASQRARAVRCLAEISLHSGGLYKRARALMESESSKESGMRRFHGLAAIGVDAEGRSYRLVEDASGASLVGGDD